MNQELLTGAGSGAAGRFRHAVRLVLCVFFLTVCAANPAAVSADEASWNSIVVSEIGKVTPGGGYSTAVETTQYPRTSWEGMKKAWYWSRKSGISIRLEKARPSFCSSACYMMLLKALSVWDEEGVISKKAWIALRPYTVKGMKYPAQDDGVGCFGYANANGPGVAMLVKTIGAGTNYYIGGRKEYDSAAKWRKAWKKAKKGDFLKLFFNSKIGRSESGHQVIFMGREKAYKNGVRDDLIYYWSSQGSTDGYGIASRHASEIRRAVLTKITNPGAFAEADTLLPPDQKNQWLNSLLRKNVSVKAMKKQILPNESSSSENAADSETSATGESFAGGDASATGESSASDDTSATGENSAGGDTSATGDASAADENASAPTLAPSPGKDAKVVEGYYYLRPNCSKKRVLSVAKKSLKEGAKMYLYKLKYAQYETFYIEPAGKGLYTIRNMKSGLYLMAENAGTAKETNVCQGKKDGSLAQKWYIAERKKGLVIQSAISQNVLTVEGSKDLSKQPVYLNTDRARKGQTWALTRFIRPDGNWKKSKRVWKGTKADYKILGNILGAIESGDQIYGNLKYDSYDPPYKNTPNEHTITIGWPQCYGPEAQELLRAIFNKNKKAFRKIDAALPAGKRIENYLNRDITAMHWRPSSKQKRVIVKLLTSPAGKACQDAQFRNYMKSFVRDCTSTYTRNAWAVVMYCEIRHLGGKNGATRIFNACGGDYSLKRIMSVLKRDQANGRSNYQVGDKIFWTRHECVCTFLETFMS